jgi:hypothetical protein
VAGSYNSILLARDGMSCDSAQPVPKLAATPEMLIRRSSTTFSDQLTECFRYLARHFKTNPTETVRSVLG